MGSPVDPSANTCTCTCLENCQTIRMNSGAMLHLGRDPSVPGDKFKVVATGNLTKLRIKGHLTLEELMQNAGIFAKKVARAMQGRPIPKTKLELENIDLTKLRFDIRNAEGAVVHQSSVGTSATNLHKEKGRNHFLELLGKTDALSAHVKKGKNFLVVTETTPRRRRLVERRPIPRLYNQILDANGL